MPHPNSLMYNAYPIPFWPMKVYWTLRKVTTTSLILIWCIGCPDRANPGLPRRSWRSPWRQDFSRLLHYSRPAPLSFLNDMDVLQYFLHPNAPCHSRGIETGPLFPCMKLIAVECMLIQRFLVWCGGERLYLISKYWPYFLSLSYI